MRTLITGGTGFVGRHLCMALSQKGVEVISVSRREGIDIRDRKKLRKTIRSFLPDIVFHLASVVKSKGVKGEREQIATNIMGTKNLIDAIEKESPSSLLIFVSSSEVYGWGNPPFSEDTLPLPANFYGITKLAGEHIVLSASISGKMRTLVVRPFNHTGPGQNENYVCSYIGKVFAEVRMGKKPPVLEIGNLEVRREFLDVADVVSSYILLAERGRKGEIYNVCRGESYSIRKVIEIFEGISGIKMKIKVKKKRKRIEPFEIKGNPDKLRNTISINFRPLEDTLRRVYEYWIERI